MLSKSSKSKVTADTSRKPLPVINNKYQLFSPTINLKMPTSSLKIEKKIFESNKSQLLKAKPSRKNNIKVHTQISRSDNSKRGLARQRQYHKYGQHIIQEQLQQINALFRKINKLRQQNGVVSLGDDIDYGFPNDNHQIPYNPELYEMNQLISKYKGQIEVRIQRILHQLRQLPQLRQTFEQLIQAQSKCFLKANQQYGKMNAMKAQHRLIMSNKEVLQKLNKY